MNLNWQIHTTIKSNRSAKRLPEILSAIFSRRQILLQDQADFLDPPHPVNISLSQIGADTDMAQKAIGLIKESAKDPGRPIIIYGDYDADGITSAAIIWELLRDLGIEAKPFIPRRRDHGYGLSIAGIDEIFSLSKPALIIAVDNGVTAHETTRYAQQKGSQVIVIDHHVLTGSEHPADALIHSLQTAGSGLTWLFANFLEKDSGSKRFTDATLELAAIGTIADMVPLVGVNRAIAKHGLADLRRSKRTGIRCLISAAGLNQADLTAHQLGFHLAPRLNATGRLTEAIDSLRLLCTNDTARAQKLADLLSQTNTQRQEMTDEMTRFAHEAAAKLDEPAAIVLADKQFHEGIIGLVAGKIAKTFWRPTVVISQGEKFSKGSARSIPGINMIEALREMGDYFEGVGGHPMAAGFTIKTRHIAPFQSAFNQLIKSKLTPQLLTKTLSIDSEILFSDISPDLIAMIDQLQPLGIGNPMPVFSASGVNILDFRPVGNEGQHLKLHLDQDGLRFSGIGFNLGPLAPSVSTGSSVAIAFTPEVSTWNGRSRIELKLKDIRRI